MKLVELLSILVLIVISSSANLFAAEKSQNGVGDDWLERAKSEDSLYRTMDVLDPRPGYIFRRIVTAEHPVEVVFVTCKGDVITILESKLQKDVGSCGSEGVSTVELQVMALFEQVKKGGLVPVYVGTIEETLMIDKAVFSEGTLVGFGLESFDDKLETAYYSVDDVQMFAAQMDDGIKFGGVTTAVAAGSYEQLKGGSEFDGEFQTHDLSDIMDLWVGQTFEAVLSSGEVPVVSSVSGESIVALAAALNIMQGTEPD